MQFSPANTSKTLSTYADKGLYFRNAPSDILQGQVLGEIIAGDGNPTLAIINRDDAYGNGFAEDLKASFEAAGGEVVVHHRVRPAGRQLRRRGPGARRPGRRRHRR